MSIKAILVFCLTSSIVYRSFAQVRLSLSPPHPFHTANRLPFDRVVVYDNRFDTAKFKTIQNGGYPVGTMQFKGQLSAVVESYIDEATRGLVKMDQALYISIRQLRFTNVNPRLFFLANAYIGSGDRFQRIAVIRKFYIPDGHGYTDSSIKRAIVRAMHDLIKEVDVNYYRVAGRDTVRYTLDEVNSNVTREWSEYPILKESSLADGIFSSFEGLRNNHADLVDFELRMNGDSTSTIGFSTNNKYFVRKNDHHSIWVIRPNDNFWTSDSGRFRNIWAVRYKGELYFNIGKGCFLPLYRLNNTFYFYIPHALPDMYSLLSGSQLIYPDVRRNQLTFSPNPYVYLLGTVLGTLQQEKSDAAVEKNRQDILMRGLGRDMRTCFLDMDTGDIVYF